LAVATLDIRCGMGLSAASADGRRQRQDASQPVSQAVSQSVEAESQLPGSSS